MPSGPLRSAQPPSEPPQSEPPRSEATPGAAAGRRGWAGLIGKGALATVSLLVLSLTGYAWTQYHSLDSGVHKSGALSGEATSLNGDTNILIMGLDTRLDEDGNPLPADIYAALHAGTANDGGENANVLMLLHVPADGSKATSISIPRDDYVSLPNCPDGQCHGKVKQAYGLAYDAESKKIVNQTGLTRAQRVQQERDAGRKAEVDTVRQLLGGVPIDHYVEVTLVAFLQIARVVQPITVCLTNDTQDDYSGANFHKGQQQINAEQAVEFVRQRRDYVHPGLNFTDLDRERRQQAFISSLAYQLKQAGTLTNPTKLQGLLDVAKQNLSIDNGLDLLSFAGQASNLTGGNVSFVTLPVDHFGSDPSGEDVNMINVAAIQALVHQLIGGGTPPPAASAPPASDSSASPSPPSGVVDVLNANGKSGLASEVERALVAKGYTEGTAKNDSRHLSTSTIYYGSGESSAAAALSTLLGGIPTHADSAVSAGHVRVVLGTDFSMPSSLTTASAPDTGSAPGAGSGPVVVPAAAPSPSTDPNSSLSVVSGGGDQRAAAALRGCAPPGAGAGRAPSHRLPGFAAPRPGRNRGRRRDR